MLMEASYSASDAAASPPHPSSFDTSPSQAWIDAMAWAKINSKQPEVRANPGDSLTSIASSHHVALSGVEEANPQIPDPSLIYPGETVYLPKSTPAQIVAGVDDSQIKPIITDLANANLADQGVVDANRTHDPSAEADAQGQQTAAWTAVQHATYAMLLDNMSPTTPDKTAVAQVQHLNALEPGNTKFADANNAALQQWQQLNFGPILAAYNSGLKSSAQQTTLANAIRTSFSNAANQAGSDPKARGQAITTQAALLQMFGPRNPTFQTAVRNAVGFAQPTDESATTLPGSSHPGNDPFNIIISGNSNVTLKQFLAGLEAIPDPAGQPPAAPAQYPACPTPGQPVSAPPAVPGAQPNYCYEPSQPSRWAQVPASNSLTNPGVGPEYANVQPPGKGSRVVQPISMRIGGQSTEFDAFGFTDNHFRLYEQQPLSGNKQGAYFISSSVEKFNIDYTDPLKSYHDVVTNGYNQGRDDLLSDIKTAAKMQGWTVQVEEYPSAPGTGSNGISYDGNIYVVTLTHDKSGSAIS